jgi:hypothetical protein
MQEISSNSYTKIFEDDITLIFDLRGIALRWSIYIHREVSKLFGRIHKSLPLSLSATPKNRHEVVIMYFGRTSEVLMMNSERMVIPKERFTLGQLLSTLYKRGGQWEDELDDSQLQCTVNGLDAKLFDTITVDAEICITSKRVPVARIAF